MVSHPSLNTVDHRPWPLPERRWTWRQSWCHLLFAHWRVPAEEIARYLPPPLEVDTFDGEAFVALVPFQMHDVALRPFPPVPGTASFPELNLRTYVRHGDRPGVWFFSLDASNALAVWAARTFFHLPYYSARMRLSADEVATYQFESQRLPRRYYLKDQPQCRFRAQYRPTSAPRQAMPGTLEHFLTERYCLYADFGGGDVRRLEVHHKPWPLCDAEAELHENSMFQPWRLTPYGAPIFHFADRVDVVTWPADRLHSAALHP